MTADQPQRAPTWSVEDVVREVLARLSAAGVTEIGNKQGLAEAGGATTATSATNELRLTEKVISVRELSGRLTNVKRLIVRPKAIVTPAARDLLRERRVELIFSDREQTGLAAASGKKAALVLGIAGTKYEPSAIVRALAREGTEIEQLARTGLLAVVDELSAAVSRGGQTGWLLSGDVAAAVCLANRHSGVRAAGAATLSDVRAAMRSVGANLLIADPHNKSFWELLQIGRTFVAGEPRECPAAYQDRLA